MIEISLCLVFSKEKLSLCFSSKSIFEDNLQLQSESIDVTIVGICDVDGVVVDNNGLAGREIAT